jgi:hypothetical protein
MSIAKSVMQSFYRKAEGKPERLPWHRESPSRVLQELRLILNATCAEVPLSTDAFRDRRRPLRGGLSRVIGSSLLRCRRSTFDADKRPAR